MRKLRTVVLLAVAAMAVMAFAASTASAQELEIRDEATNNICGAVTLSGTDVNGGCLIHATSEGEVELRKHVFGIESHITTCKNEFHGRVASGSLPSTLASGYIFEQVLTSMPSPHRTCERQPCKNTTTGEQIPWSATGQEAAAQEAGTNGSEFLTTNFCVEPNGGGTDEMCEIDVPFDAKGLNGNHSQEFGHAAELAAHGISGFRCELVGHWNTETSGVHTGTGEPDPGGSAEQEVLVTHLD